jgi:hypothetical protein
MLLSCLSSAFLDCDVLVNLVCDYICINWRRAAIRVSRTVLDKSRRWRTEMQGRVKRCPWLYSTEEECLAAFVHDRVRRRRRFYRGNSSVCQFSPECVLTTRQEEEARTKSTTAVSQRSRNKTVVLQLLMYGESFVQNVLEEGDTEKNDSSFV